MADYNLSAELSLKDRFTSKINNATYKSNKFKSSINRLDSKLKNLEKVKSFEKVALKASSVLRVTKKLGSTNSFDKMKEKIGQVGTSVKKLGNHFNNLGNRIGKISSKISSFGGKIKKAIKWGVAGTAGALGGALKIGGDFETLGARLKTAFNGNQKKASEYYKWANEFANNTPFENEEIIDATVRLKSYGYDPKRLMTLLGDMAGAYGKTLEQSVEAYADASRGEFERLKEFGIQKDEVLNYAKKTLGKEVKMSGAQVKDMDTFMKALEGVIKERSQGGMKALANTLKGMLSTTTGLLKYNVAKLIGVTDEGKIRAGSVMDRVKQKFEKFNNYLQSPEAKKALEKWIEKFEKSIPKILKLGSTIRNKFEEIFGDDFITKLNNSIANFKVDNLVNEFDRVIEKLKNIYETIQNIGATAIGAKIGAFFGGVPGAVVGGAVGFGISSIANNLDDSTKLVSDEKLTEKEKNESVKKLKGIYDDTWNPYYKTTNEIMEEKINNNITNNKKIIENKENVFNTENIEEKTNQYIQEKIKTENKVLNDYSNKNSNFYDTSQSKVTNTSYYQKPKLDFNVTFDFKGSTITMENFEEKMKTMSENYFENIAEKYFQDMTGEIETSY